MALSDELARVDAFVEGVLKKVERQVADSYAALKGAELAAKRAKAAAAAGAAADAAAAGPPPVVPALGLRCAGKPVHEYVARFKWDAATWDPREALPDAVKRMALAAERIDADLRGYVVAYAEKKTAALAAERKRGGNLAVAPLDDVLTPAALKRAGAEWIGAEDSEFLASLALVVPKAAEDAFLAGYAAYAGTAVPVGPEGKREAATAGPAVPGSARKLAEDKDGYVLYTVVVLKKYADAFRAAAKERRIAARDFELTPHAAGAAARAADAAAKEAAAALTLLKDVSRARYEETVSLWMHVKAVRVFVGAVLQYGLPVGFTAVLFKLHRGGSGGAPAAAAAARRLLDAVTAAWEVMARGSRLVDEAAATAAAAPRAATDEPDEDDDRPLPVVVGVTDGAAARPFVLVDMEVRHDTSAHMTK